MKPEDLMGLVVRALTERYLCYHCLGRLFSSLLRGVSNYERGKSIATATVMWLYGRAASGDEEARRTLGRLRLHQDFRRSLEELGLSWSDPGPCYVCGGLMDRLEEIARKVAEKLYELKAESFVIGVVGDDRLLAREDELWRALGLAGQESVRNEVKREVGKRVQALVGVPVDFARPGVMVKINLSDLSLETVSNPILFGGLYLKLGRNISQSLWLSPSRGKAYPFSIEEAANSAWEYLLNSRVAVHAAGREDVDVRMLGSGRPVVLEVKSPARRNVSHEVLCRILNKRNRWVRFKLTGPVSRKDVRMLKLSDRLHTKVYRALVYVPEGVDARDAEVLESSFRRTLIRQRTPTRVLWRRADMVRAKSVYWLKARVLGRRWLEVFVATEGGLYVKELVSGDFGRTQPSLSSVLGKTCLCAELDVLLVADRQEGQAL